MDKKKITIGILLLIIVSSSIIYIQYMDKVRIRVDNDKTTFYVPHENYSWIWTVAGREENRLFDGTSIMYRQTDGIQIDKRINNETQEIWIERRTPYQRGQVIIDTYYFRGDVEGVEYFPISHKVTVLNAKGKFYRYTVDDLTDTGEKRKLIDETELSFGKNMNVELQKDYRWAWIGWPYGSNSLSAQYDINSNNETFYVRLFDPYYTSRYYWNDDFEDSSINESLWDNKTYSCQGGSNPGSESVVEEGNFYTDGSLRAYVLANSAPGNSVRRWAAFWTNQDFKEGEDYQINFTINGTEDSAVSNLYFTKDESSSGPTCGTSSTMNDKVDEWNSTLIYSFSETELEQSPVDYSLDIDSSAETVTFSNDTEILATKDISVIENWHIIFEQIAAESDGPSDSMDFYLFNFTVLSYQDPLINFTFPEEETYYQTQKSTLNYSLKVLNGEADSCWYSLNGGETNTTVVCHNNVTGISSSEGENDWMICSNDTLGQKTCNYSTFYIDTTNPGVLYGSGTNDNDTWYSTPNITIDAIVNENNTKNITFRLYNETGEYNITSYNMKTENDNNSIIFYDVPNGNYTFNFTVFDLSGRNNSSESRITYIDSISPIISYTPNSDDSNTSANFNNKDWIFVNVSITETKEDEIVFNLYTREGIVNSTSSSDGKRTINWTGLSGGTMYYWNVSIIDKAGNKENAGVRKYGEEIINFSIQREYDNVSAELGTDIELNGTNTLDNICFSIDHPDYGKNYTCSFWDNLINLTINYFNKKLFSDGSSYKNFVFGGIHVDDENLSITSHRYDEVVNLSFNMSGDAKNVLFYGCNTTTRDRIYEGVLRNKNIYLNKTTTGETNKTIGFSSKGDSLIYFYLDDNANIKNISLNISSEKFGFNYTNSFSNYSDIDESQTDAHLALIGKILPKKSNKKNYTFDDFNDGAINSSLWTYSCPVSSSSEIVCTSETGGNLKSRIFSDNGDDLASATLPVYTYNISGVQSEDIYFPLEVDFFGSMSNDFGVGGDNFIQFGGEKIWEMNIPPSDLPSGSSEASAKLFFHIEQFNTSHFKVTIDGTENSSNTDGYSKEIVYDNNVTYVSASIVNFLNFYISITKGSDDPYVDNTLLVDYINRTLSERENSSVISNSIYNPNSNIQNIDNITLSGFFPENETLSPYLSADDGQNWEGVSLNSAHSFSNPGKNLRWRLDFNISEPKDKTNSIEISKISIQLEKNNLSNLTFDFGNDGISDYNISGIFSKSNGSKIINLTNSDLSSSFVEDSQIYSHLYKIPLEIGTDTPGELDINWINITYDPNPVFINTTFIQDYLNNYGEGITNFTIPLRSQEGSVNITNLNYNYAGGNETIKVTAQNNDNSLNLTRYVTFYYSRWDYSFVPNLVDFLEFVPDSPSKNNVTPYGQSDINPIINITNYGYGGKDSNLSVYLENTSNCVNLTISTTNSKSDGYQLNESWEEIVSNKEYLNTTNIWMWADYDCSYNNWRLFNPNLYFRQCANNTYCSEDLI